MSIFDFLVQQRLAIDFKDAITRSCFGQGGGDPSKNDAGIASHGIAEDRFLVATLGAAMDLDLALIEMSPSDAELIEEELLVEEVSIDGMCGVY